MNAHARSTLATQATSSSPSVLTALRGLLLLEAVAAFAVTVFLSLVAAGLEGGLGDPEAATRVRFAAGGALILSLLALATSRGVRRRRGWSWTLAAILQVVLAVGTGVAVMAIPWHPALLVGFAVPVVVMLVLSLTSVRRDLGQL